MENDMPDNVNVPTSEWSAKSDARVDNLRDQLEQVASTIDAEVARLQSLYSDHEERITALEAAPQPPPQPEPEPEPEPTPTPGETRGIWISHDELQALPIEGPAWESVVGVAGSDEQIDLAGRTNRGNVIALAAAMVAVRLESPEHREKALRLCMDAIGTEETGSKADVLSAGRNVGAVVCAADIIGLRDQEFVDWVDDVRRKTLDGRTLISSHEDRPNNWGTHAGFARLACAAYLDDADEIARCWQVYQGYVGNRDAYAGFRYGNDLSWQADPEAPVGINTKGAKTRDGFDIDGVPPDDQRRSGPFTPPPYKRTNYAWEGMQGLVCQAYTLFRLGFDAFEVQDQAILRTLKWLHKDLFEGGPYVAEGDDTWQPHLVNWQYKASFPAPVPSRHGKCMGFTDWTHASSS